MNPRSLYKKKGIDSRDKDRKRTPRSSYSTRIRPYQTKSHRENYGKRHRESRHKNKSPEPRNDFVLKPTTELNSAAFVSPASTTTSPMTIEPSTITYSNPFNIKNGLITELIVKSGNATNMEAVHHHLKVSTALYNQWKEINPKNFNEVVQANVQTIFKAFIYDLNITVTKVKQLEEEKRNFKNQKGNLQKQ